VDEIGDLLFTVVNLARRLETDPEQALRGACRKFERRFRAIEDRLAARGASPES
jgi:nucleoside triphosphate diphosphatase